MGVIRLGPGGGQITLDILHGSRVITRVLLRGRQEVRVREIGRCSAAGFEDGGRSQAAWGAPKSSRRARMGF